MNAQIKIASKTNRGWEIKPVGEVFPLGRVEQYTVGRAPENSIVIDKNWPGAEYVSRRHLKLIVYTGEGYGYITKLPGGQLSDEGIEMFDEGSENGTYFQVFIKGKTGSTLHLGHAGVANGFHAAEFGPGDGVRIWLSSSPEKSDKGIMLDIFDSRPPLTTPEGNFGPMDFPKGPEGIGFAP